MTLHPLRTALLLTCALSPSALIAAEDAPPPEGAESDTQIVITATRTPVEAEDVPATVTVIDAEQIADELVTDIKDLVRYEPGVSVPRRPARFGAALGTTGRARNEDFVIRGIGGNRVLIQVDGIRTPQGFTFGAQEAGRGGYTDVGLVKSVEILRGPASALYGSDGLAGAISFTTSDPVDLVDAGNTIGGFARASYSSADEEFAETAAVAGLFGDVSAMLAYTRRDFAELENKGTVGGIGESRTLPNPQDGESNAVLGKLVWEGGAHRLRLTGEYIESEVDTDVLSGQGPQFLFGPSPSYTVDDLTAHDTTKRGRVSLDWTYSGSASGEGVIDYAHLAAYYQSGEDVQFTDEDRSPIGATPRPDRERLNTFENEVFGLAAEARSVLGSDAFRATLALGGDVSFTRQEGLRDGTEPPAGEVYPTRAFPATDFMLGGVFLASEFALFDGALTIFPALRFDFYDLDPTDDPLLPGFAGAAQSDSRVSPKLGVTARLAEDVVAFGNYAQGFRAPTPFQVNNFFENLAYGYTSLPNPDLGPERSESWEGGVRYAGDTLSLQVVGFAAEYEDFISQQVVGGSFTPSDPAQYQYVNYDSVEISGVEAKAGLRFDNGVHGRFAIAYADGEITTPGSDPRPLDSIDPLNLVAGIGYAAPGGSFGGELIVIHHTRKDIEDTIDACSTECYRPGAFLVVDATAYLAITDALKLRAGIFNITDEKYAYWQDVRGLSATSSTTDAYTRPGRNASVSLSFRF
ncbi:TonB-dependent hemoglobin/transferrin/lactoferrin family receptor [Pseudoblastomonas halimionae]|uniref:TonB-dependent hemoglobin/transferrin/lactoferrin family receptor n=1 Tax=Alteriqipengyuania halimionae TaxID=1926630 RepID=A0A6I4U566_9SPHN|nr:TonB-dependent hemoglobin/transferrin/lactoferrin family receptor [Alteriqipengyuania halimionae]MXP10504.1 TonB-dependent hemoglobin/transferrin/lactoferrin family receptor [Alteriqipengyuania halimionae]